MLSGVAMYRDDTGLRHPVDGTIEPESGYPKYRVRHEWIPTNFSLNDNPDAADG